MLPDLDALPSLASLDPAGLLVAIGMRPDTARAVLLVILAVLLVQAVASLVAAARLARARWPAWVPSWRGPRRGPLAARAADPLRCPNFLRRARLPPVRRGLFASAVPLALTATRGADPLQPLHRLFVGGIVGGRRGPRS
jgi:hypothetical protein